ncbi:MAG: hypothetical protein WBP13_10605 [Methylophilaceae bacterium]
MQVTSDSIKEQIPYYLTQKAKENLAKALDNFPRGIEYYINRYEDEVLQGDGWASISIINFDTAEKRLIKGILLTNSCDIAVDNKREFPVKLTFAPIIKLGSYVALLTSKIDKKKIEDKIVAIKEQKITSVFYLPKGAGLEEDYIALLDDLHTVPYSVFSSQENRKKIFTLGQVGFYLYLLKLSVHFCRFHEEIPREEV